MHTIVGQCPKCGAPIYVPTSWWGIFPPPPIYSCCGAPIYVPTSWSCVPHNEGITTTHTNVPTEEPAAVDEKDMTP